jgi:hypothetical protein
VITGIKYKGKQSLRGLLSFLSLKQKAESRKQKAKSKKQKAIEANDKRI